MAFGMIPARGPWEYRWFTVSSAATFVKGALVAMGSGYSVREYASTDSQALGISLQSSTNSQFIQSLSSAVMVAIPLPGCTAYSDVTTGVTASAMSVGKVVNIYKEGNYMSYASTVIGHASLFSALVTIVGPLQSGTSQVEVAFNMPALVFYSSSTHTFATGG